MVAARSKGWQSAFTHTGGCHHRPLDDAVYEPCPQCWGQKKIYVPSANGEGLIPVKCRSCGGGGLRLVFPQK